MSDRESNEALHREAMSELDELLDQTHERRVARLDELARNRPELHSLVVALLAHEDTVVGGFMERGALRQSGVLRPDVRLGLYRIIRVLGEGGMGEVWLARRDDGLYQGEVAIKTLHPFFAGGALRERFLREAQVLGRLAHPNIARLLDAGVHDGVVYLILEYVSGRPLDQACDEERLDVRARLVIFQQLCAAVAHAHSSLVVHRDIKPGNVLLTADGVPKLLDFGIASFYEPEKAEPSDVTRLTGRVFTPEYAAPEQVLGQQITTATDVYSLGVLLYVLLTGQLPHGRAKGNTQWEQAVLNAEPQRMTRMVDQADREALAASRSTSYTRLRSQLRGDLESIVQTAMRKKPEDRYATVAALSDDLRRYLNGEPVMARADSAWYRIGKFARRNRIAVGAAAAVVTALGIGLAVSLWQLRVAREERRHAEEVTEFVADIFRSADPFFTGKADMSAVELLALAHERIEQEMQAKPEAAAELLNIVGESQLNLERYQEAGATFTKAADIARHMNPPDEAMLAVARAGLYKVAIESADPKLAETLLEQALPVLRKHQPRTGREYAGLLQISASQDSDEGRRDVAIAKSREAVTVLETLYGPKNSETILSKRNLALYLVLERRYAEAKPLLEQSLRHARELPSSSGRLALLELGESTYARMLIDSGDIATGVGHLNTAIDLGIKAFGARSETVSVLLSQLIRAQARMGDLRTAISNAQRAYEGVSPSQGSARAMTNWGRYTLMARQVPESLQRLQRAIELEKQLDPGKGSWLPIAQSEYGTALALSGRFTEAAQVLEANLPVAMESGTGGAKPSALNALGQMRQLQLQWAESEDHFRKALEFTSPNDLNQKMRADAMTGIGLTRLELGQLTEAEQWFRQAGDAARITYLNFIPLRADIAVCLGRALLKQGKVSEARDSFTQAHDYWQNYDPANRAAGEAEFWLGQAHSAAGEKQKARASFSRARAVLKTSPLPGDQRLAAEAGQILAGT